MSSMSLYWREIIKSLLCYVVGLCFIADICIIRTSHFWDTEYFYVFDIILLFNLPGQMQSCLAIIAFPRKQTIKPKYLL